MATSSPYPWIPVLVFIAAAAVVYFSWPKPVYETQTPSSVSSSITEEEVEEGEATVDGVDDFGACDEEAHELCSGFYTADWQGWAQANGYTSASWKLGLVDCLADHRDETSQTCDDSLDRRQELNDELNEACRTDRIEFCPGVVPAPGSEPQVDCLKEHYDELSLECAAAVDAHEAAKPVS